jgi:hypothetical protein
LQSLETESDQGSQRPSCDAAIRSSMPAGVAGTAFR